MSALGKWMMRNRMNLAVGGLGAAAAASLVTVAKGERKREEDFAQEGQMHYTKGDLHPHPATELYSVEEVACGVERLAVGG